jgi:adenylylsulfate kinase
VPVSWAIWVTGRPGSGKSTLARAAAARLAESGAPVAVLELDRIRRVLTPTPTYSDAEREVVYRALVFMAATLTEAGVPVLIDATAHRREWRDLARASIGRFAEVQLECPLELAEARERTRTSGHAPRGIYATATRAGATVPGVNVPYERAELPELVVDTAAGDVAAAADRIAELGRALGTSRPRGGPRDGAVIWMTGPPGSGKTTLSSRLAEALAAEGISVTVLEWAALRALVFGGGSGHEAGDDIAHRALAYTAKLLADEGLTVVVDATAPRRTWRALAREITATFAEVQLICPPEICLDRERAVRWGRRPCPHRGSVVVDIVPQYEYSLSPDLTVDTAARSEWAAGEDLLRLARRLLRRPPR